MKNFRKNFNGKTVLITGHTGFKGSWLTTWLLELGAKVVGVSDCIPTTPSHFTVAHLAKHIQHITANICDARAVRDIVCETQPDFVFHLAAQPLVRRSYADPLTTFQTNTLGTVYVLDALLELTKPCVAVMITSDKCYENAEWVWGYRETDRLGGKDPYSASKAAAEIIIRSYVESFMRNRSNICIGIGRAGNVIGGGDWAEDRLVPDCVRAWNTGRHVPVRNPNATRPWQHVLESLSGYLTLATALVDTPDLHGHAFNFGPRSEKGQSVQYLLNSLKEYWPSAGWEIIADGKNLAKEAVQLKLNCDKAMTSLNWSPTLEFGETVKLTCEWYRAYYADPDRSILGTTTRQLNEYIESAKHKGVSWAQ